jgi:hypothetical protein
MASFPIELDRGDSWWLPFAMLLAARPDLTGELAAAADAAIEECQGYRSKWVDEDDTEAAA